MTRSAYTTIIHTVVAERVLFAAFCPRASSRACLAFPPIVAATFAAPVTSFAVALTWLTAKRSWSQTHSNRTRRSSRNGSRECLRRRGVLGVRNSHSNRTRRSSWSSSPECLRRRRRRGVLGWNLNAAPTRSALVMWQAVRTKWLFFMPFTGRTRQLAGMTLVPFIVAVPATFGDASAVAITRLGANRLHLGHEICEAFAQIRYCYHNLSQNG